MANVCFRKRNLHCCSSLCFFSSWLQRLRLLIFAHRFARLPFRSALWFQHVPTICEGPHILLDSFRILPGHFVLAMNRERHIAFQVAPHLVQQLRSTDAYLVFDLGFSSELHLVVRHIAEAQAKSLALRFPTFGPITIYSARSLQLLQKSGFSDIFQRLRGRT